MKFVYVDHKNAMSVYKSVVGSDAKPILDLLVFWELNENPYWIYEVGQIERRHKRLRDSSEDWLDGWTVIHGTVERVARESTPIMRPLS